MVRPEGIEPPTLCSEDKCSNPLSYGRVSSYIHPQSLFCQDKTPKKALTGLRSGG
jgi:hypothetical protein